MCCIIAKSDGSKVMLSQHLMPKQLAKQHNQNVASNMVSMRFHLYKSASDLIVY